MLQYQFYPVVVFVDKRPFPDVLDTKGITFPFARFAEFFLVKGVEKNK